MAASLETPSLSASSYEPTACCCLPRTYFVKLFSGVTPSQVKPSATTDFTSVV